MNRWIIALAVVLATGTAAALLAGGGRGASPQRPAGPGGPLEARCPDPVARAAVQQALIAHGRRLSEASVRVDSARIAMWRAAASPSSPPEEVLRRAQQAARAAEDLERATAAALMTAIASVGPAKRADVARCMVPFRYRQSI